MIEVDHMASTAKAESEMISWAKMLRRLEREIKSLEKVIYEFRVTSK